MLQLVGKALLLDILDKAGCKIGVDERASQEGWANQLLSKCTVSWFAQTRYADLLYRCCILLFRLPFAAILRANNLSDRPSPRQLSFTAAEVPRGVGGKIASYQAWP